MSYRTLNPTTGELVESFPLISADELDAALDHAQRAFDPWRREKPAQRAALLNRIASALEEQADGLGRLMAIEMGKPLAEGKAEAGKCAWVCRYYAENGEDFMRSSPHVSDGSEARVAVEPLGPILAIMPWNFPLWQVFRFTAPALAVGNVVLLKHAPNTPGCALAIARLFAEAGAPEGVFQNLFLSNEQAAEVIASPIVKGVTLTGSTRAGRAVAGAAGQALKPMVLELGGSDPFIVFDDADFDEAVSVAIKSRCLNNGQSCIAAKRFVVQEGVFEDFKEAFLDQMWRKQVGDPLQAGTEIGPLAREDLRDTLAEQVEACCDQGADALCGGQRLDGPGFFYPPTVLTGLDAEAPAAQLELFGPVASLFSFSDEDDAVRIANITPYGLGASLWTGDAERATRLIPRIDAGSVFVNGMVKSDPRLPFGGVKDSGFGRELAREGLIEFTNLKTVWIK